MSSTNLENYLASNEELQLSVTAENVTKGENQDTKVSGDSECIFGVTDRRVVYLTDSGEFKDIDFTHISSIETSTEPKGISLFGIVLTAIGGIAVLSGLVSISENSSNALSVILIGGIVLAGGLKVIKNSDLAERQKITLITGDEADQQVEVTLPSDTNQNVGAELSRMLREKH